MPLDDARLTALSEIVAEAMDDAKAAARAGLALPKGRDLRASLLWLAVLDADHTADAAECLTWLGSAGVIEPITQAEWNDAERRAADAVYRRTCSIESEAA